MNKQLRVCKKVSFQADTDFLCNKEQMSLQKGEFLMMVLFSKIKYTGFSVKYVEKLKSGRVCEEWRAL